MPAPVNKFKAALAANEQVIGLWLGLAEPYTAELCAQVGFDWLLIDAEHSPNDVRTILHQLQAIKGSNSSPVVRPPSDDRVMLKKLLDIGVQSFLVPMVENAEQAREIVRSLHYPPKGVRGVGAGLARASDFNAITDYLQTAGDEICLTVQVETVSAVANLPEILKVDGIDGVFVGPSDLAADMGYLGRPGEAAVQEVVLNALKTIKAAGKPAGILTPDQTLARQYLDLGVSFLAVGSDISAFTSGLRGLHGAFFK